MTRAFVLLVALLASGCGGADVEPPPSVDAAGAPGQATTDAGVDAGCGLTFDEAVLTYPERVCQTTVYDRVTGYCTHWVPCSSL